MSSEKIHSKEGRMDIPNNTLNRLCRIYGYLSNQQKQGIEFVSSAMLAKAVAATDYSVRKDISLLDITGYTRKGYGVESLREELGKKLNLNQKRRACIVGLGRLGTALLDYENFQDDGFEIIAGFDKSINKIERLHTQVELFPVSSLEDTVKRLSIDVGIIAVPAEAAQEVADRLVSGGIKGILNFSPAKIVVAENIVFHDMDFTGALRFIAARF